MKAYVMIFLNIMLKITSRKEKTVINDGDTLESTTIKKTPTYCGLVHFFVRCFYI